MENPEVARIFEEIADLLDIQGENSFRVRAYRNAARTIRDLPERVADKVREGSNGLTELPGIGKDLAGKIKTIVETGDHPLRKELSGKVPPGLRDLLRVPNLGPKRARTLYERLEVGSLDDLRKAAEHHRVRKLEGFGARMEEKILGAVEEVEEAGRRILLAEAKVYAESIVRHLKKTPGTGKVEVAGSFRRRKETVGDLDLLVTCDDSGPVMDRLADYEGTAEKLARGPTRLTVRLQSGLQVDLRVVPEKSYGAAMAYFTGSKQHNIELRRRAQERGLKISEYGVFRGEKQVAGRTEEDVYASVGLPWIPPELREARGEIELAQKKCLPELIELDDIRGDLHMHTTATDGRASLEAMVAAAKKHGYAYIAITDHSKRVTMANGLDAGRLRKHWKAIERLDAKVKGLSILKGVELDILEDGSLDLPDDVLAEADWVIASIHYGLNQPREKITRRLIRAAQHPHVSALGHPTGRLIGKRKGYEVDLDAVLKAAADHGCLVECNAQPERLDLDDVALMAARDLGVGVVINTDAHATEELNNMEFGIYQARRAGLEAGDVVNTLPLSRFRKRIKV